MAAFGGLLFLLLVFATTASAGTEPDSVFISAAVKASQQCQKDLSVLHNPSNPHSQIMLGALGVRANDLGDYDLCESLQDGWLQYCVVSYPVTNFSHPVKQGLCVPSSCPESALFQELPQFVEFFPTLRNGDLHHATVTCGNHSRPVNAAGVVVIVIASLCGLLVLAGTWVDRQTRKLAEVNRRGIRRKDGGYFRLSDGGMENEAEEAKVGNIIQMPPSDGITDADGYRKMSNSSQRDSTTSDNTLGSNMGSGSFLPAVFRDETPPDYMAARADPPCGLLGHILLKFSATHNWAELQDRRKEGRYKLLDGIRTLSLVWVILGQLVMQWMAVGLSNWDAVVPPDGILSSFLGQFLTSSQLGFDALLFTSGFLAVHTILSRSDSRFDYSLLKGYPAILVHRFLCLSPAYYFTLLLFWAVLPSMYFGPFWTFVRDTCCDRFWWTNFLYINNLVPFKSTWDSMCMNWSWFFALDFQFSLLCPLLIMVYRANKLAGAAVTGVLAAASVTASTVIALRWDLNPAVTGPDYEAYMTHFYVRPYCRVSVYLIAMLFAFYIHYLQLHRKIIALRKWFAWTLLFASVVFMLFAIFGNYHLYQDPGADGTLVERVIYLALARPAFACSLGIIVFCCRLEAPGTALPNGFLSWSAWVPFSKLTYCALLLFPLTLLALNRSTTQLLRYSTFMFMQHFAAALLLSYLAALILFLIIHMPVCNVEQMLWGRSTRR